MSGSFTSKSVALFIFSRCLLLDNLSYDPGNRCIITFLATLYARKLLLVRFSLIPHVNSLAIWCVMTSFHGCYCWNYNSAGSKGSRKFSTFLHCFSCQPQFTLWYFLLIHKLPGNSFSSKKGHARSPVCYWKYLQNGGFFALALFCHKKVKKFGPFSSHIYFPFSMEIWDLHVLACVMWFLMSVICGSESHSDWTIEEDFFFFFQNNWKDYCEIFIEESSNCLNIVQPYEKKKKILCGFPKFVNSFHLFVGEGGERGFGGMQMIANLSIDALGENLWSYNWINKILNLPCELLTIRGFYPDTLNCPVLVCSVDILNF